MRPHPPATPAEAKEGTTLAAGIRIQEQVRQRQGLEMSAPLWTVARSNQHDSKNSGSFPGRKENGGDGMEIRAEDQEAMSRYLLVSGDS